MFVHVAFQKELCYIGFEKPPDVMTGDTKASVLIGGKLYLPVVKKVCHLRLSACTLERQFVRCVIIIDD